MTGSPPRSLLRPAEAADIDAITEVWYGGWREVHLGHVPDELVAHRTPQTFRDRISEVLGTTTVASVDDRVVGLVVTIDDELEQLYVAGEQRGTGVAAALLEHGEKVIARRFPEAFLGVVVGNTRARRFYARHGWNDAGPFEHAAWIPSGERVAVPCHRYEKALIEKGSPHATPETR